jgi:anti-sigma regulatory factor (Ser/Thr protein kinase)
MEFRSRRYRRLRVAIHPRVGFRKVLALLDDVAFPSLPGKAEHLKYAVLELINNSLRAHRQAGCVEPIELAIERCDTELTLRVRDYGRGFDPHTLPYSLDTDPEAIDINAAEFLEYRKAHNYERFGMGLPLVMRTFDTFRLAFVDEAGAEMPWESWVASRVRGTSITVTKALRPPEQG